MAIVFGSSAGVRQGALESYFDRIGENFNRFEESLSNLFSGKDISGPQAPFPEKKFVDDGFTNVPGTSFPGSQIENVDDLKLRRITSQEPELTVYVKKRAFWSLRNENDTRFMDNNEKLYLRASKALFQNKCDQIAAYEALTKIERIANDEVDFDSALIAQLAELIPVAQEGLINDFTQAIDTLSRQGDFAGAESLANEGRRAEENYSSFRPIIQTLERLKRENISIRKSETTKWVVDVDSSDVSNIGEGPGVIELSSISQLTTNLGLESDGSVSFTVEDPYNLTKITNEDIEVALARAFGDTNPLLNNTFESPESILSEARDLEDRLRSLRNNRINEFFGLGGNGSILSGQDASEIIFEINPSSRAGKKVAIGIGSSPQTFSNISEFFANNLREDPQNQLTFEEQNLARRIFDKLEAYVDSVRNRLQRSLLDNSSEQVRYARRNLRLFYLGKSIIQPMDGIHVYLRGKTFQDSEIIGPLNYLLNNTSFVKSFSEDDNVNDAVLEREMIEFGINPKEFPLELYKNIRTGSFLRTGGIHVFGGLITTVSESYSNGRYLLNVQGESNLKWLNITQANTRPSLQNINGVLQDPLTPYKLDVDPATGLIKQNPELLDINKGRVGCLRYNDGPWRGELLEESNVTQDESSLNGNLIPIDQHAPGLVYTWKQGIVAVTANVNLKTALDGDGKRISQLNRDAGLIVTNEPFAGLDAADVISLLVTGFPHNYESFFLNSRDAGTFVPDTGTNSPDSFFQTFFNLQQSTNKAQGNFQPAKETNVPPSVFRDLARITSNLRSSQEELSSLRSKLAKIQDEILALNIPLENLSKENQGLDGDDARKATEDGKRTLASLKNTQNDIASQITNLERNFYREFDSANSGTSGLRIVGNDIAFDVEIADDPNTEDLNEEYKNLRLRNTFQFLRSQRRCKFNEDKNKFIVGDEYDKDLDIQAFVLNLGNNKPDLWNSQYKFPIDICRNVAKTLDFHFFCDTQGNIQFRPPRYNKIPLSLLLKLFLISDQENRQLYPPFLRSLFETRLSINNERIQAVELEIQEKEILLGENINTSSRNEKVTTENSSFTISDKISPTNNSAILGNIRELENSARKLLEIRNSLAEARGSQPTAINDLTIDKAEEEITSLNDPSAPNVSTRRLAELSKLARLITQKQQLKDVSDKLQQQEQFLSTAETTPDSEIKTDFQRGQRVSQEDAAKLLAPFQDLIEDDLNDFLGPGSSKRYIIRDEDIISYSFTESDKNISTRYDVTGQLGLIGGGPGQIGSIPAIWAGATDFDLWRQYGYRPSGSIAKPYFVDAELQCAPYAQMLLTRARKEAVTGTVTIRGNEYYQLGDVVYLNSRDTLYYVTDVQHEFSYESKRFTTTLILKYGHPLGEFIPRPLDVIGKNLIKNQTRFSRRFTVRNVARIDTGVSLGTILFVPNANQEKTLDEIKISMLSGDLGKSNLLRLKNIFALAKTRIDENPNFKLDIRSFKLDTRISDQTLLNQAEAVKQWLLSPTGIYSTDPNETGIEASDENGDFENIEPSIAERPFSSNNFLSSSSSLNPIDCFNIQKENKEKFRFPKEDPWNMSRTQLLDDVVEVVLVEETNT